MLMALAAILYTVFFLPVFARAIPLDPEDRGMLRVINHIHTQQDSDYVRNPDPEHSERSYSAEGIGRLINKALGVQADVMIITDHNTTAHCEDPVFKNFRDPRLLLICGSEWTSKHGPHINIFWPKGVPVGTRFVPLNADEAASEDEITCLIRQVHSLGGYASINHPGFKMYQVSGTLGADFVEGLVPLYNNPFGVLKWWDEKILLQKMPIPGVAASDYHVGSRERAPFEEPMSLLAAAEKTPQAILEAMSAGKAIMINRWDQRARVQAELGSTNFVDHDGTFSALPGETFHIRKKGALLSLKIKTTRALGSKLLVSLNGQTIFSGKIRRGFEDLTLSILPPDRFSFVRAELRNTGDEPVVVLNPIYIEP